MKFRLILPALAGLILTQFAPQAAWSWDGCRYESPRQIRHQMWRAERFGYAAPYGYAPYGYGPAPCYHRGLIGTFGRAIF